MIDSVQHALRLMRQDSSAGKRLLFFTDEFDVIKKFQDIFSRLDRGEVGRAIELTALSFVKTIGNLKVDLKMVGSSAMRGGRLTENKIGENYSWEIGKDGAFHIVGLLAECWREICPGINIFSTIRTAVRLFALSTNMTMTDMRSA